MTRRFSTAGFTIVELLAALVVFALAATAAAQTLSAAQRARGGAGNLMLATQLAAERLERIRAGDRGEDVAVIGMFERSWRAETVSPDLGLDRVDVRVAWQEAGSREVTLSTLLRRHR